MKFTTTRKRFTLLLVNLSSLVIVSCAQEREILISKDLSVLKDSLNTISYSIPQIKYTRFEKVVDVRTQDQWNDLANTISNLLINGNRNIEIRIKGKELIMPIKPKKILNLNYPDANIRIIGEKAKLLPEGLDMSRDNPDIIREGSFWILPYDRFNIDDIITDENESEITLREEMNSVSSTIESVTDLGGEVWRMQTELPDLSEECCKDFYILLTRDWTSARHRVLKVKDKWLYFYLDSDDLHSDRDPNIDQKLYGVSPRYRLINSPISKGVHVTKGKIYIPWHFKKIRINKGGNLLHINGCIFNSLEITGFQLNGLKSCPIEVYNSTFSIGMFVHHNIFNQLSSLAFSTVNCKNIVFSDNTITNTRGRTIGFTGENFTICRNHLKNIGWMLNTTAICAGGDNLHICDNVIEDFNYSAIACGSRAPTRDSVRLTYIIERNLIKLSNQYTDNYIVNTLADGGAIYIGPSCTQGIIRNNVIQNIKGIHGNRGVFLDDGAKNLAIYGNLIMNTHNYYDIDLRLVNTFEKDIPDHNTHNSIFHNIMTGGYCFQEASPNSNCIGGQNILLGLGRFKKRNINITHYVEDISIKECSIKKDRIFIKSRYKKLLDSIYSSSYITNYFVYK